MSNSLAYQDDFLLKRREELIGGKVVSMSPRPSFNHNRVAENIDFIFRNYLRRKKCMPLGDGYALYLDADNQFVPDFMVVCDPDKIKPDGVHGTPDLVVEVLSPSTAKIDKTLKKDAYAKCGVREYWLVSPGDKSVEAYRLDGAAFILYDIYTVHADWQLAQMSEEERAAVVTHFKCSLFDYLDISLEEIFHRTF